MSMANCNSVISITTCYGLDCLGINSDQVQGFLHRSRPAMVHTQPYIQWVPCHFQGSSGQDVALNTHLTPSAEFKYSIQFNKKYNYMSTSPLGFHGRKQGELSLYLTSYQGFLLHLKIIPSFSTCKPYSYESSCILHTAIIVFQNL